jgi:hypothetical protein
MSNDRERGEAMGSSGMTDARQPVASIRYRPNTQARPPHSPLGGDTRAKQDSYPDDLPQPYMLQCRRSENVIKAARMRPPSSGVRRGEIGNQQPTGGPMNPLALAVYRLIRGLGASFLGADLTWLTFVACPRSVRWVRWKGFGFGFVFRPRDVGME